MAHHQEQTLVIDPKKFEEDPITVAAHVSVNDPARLLFLQLEAKRQACFGEADFVEMGVFKGGTAIILAHALRLFGSRRKLHLLDAWQGLPAPTEQDAGTILREGVFAEASEKCVKETLATLGLLDHCAIHKGWFENTLEGLNGSYALAHIDCDFYVPVKQCLEHIIPRMTNRGSIIVDDFGSHRSRRFPGVEKAVVEVTRGTPWKVIPLGASEDQSVLLIR